MLVLVRVGLALNAGTSIATRTVVLLQCCTGTGTSTVVATVQYESWWVQVLVLRPRLMSRKHVSHLYVYPYGMGSATVPEFFKTIFGKAETYST